MEIEIVKTSLGIPADLWRRAKDLAAAERSSLQAIIVRGLRLAVDHCEHCISEEFKNRGVCKKCHDEAAQTFENARRRADNSLTGRPGA